MEEESRRQIRMGCHSGGDTGCEDRMAKKKKKKKI
jgi:hypothetical protein